MSWILKVYAHLVGIQIRSQMQYRLGFVVDALSAALTPLIGIGSLALVFDRFGNIAGWKIGEIAFLYGMVELSFGTMDMLFSGFDPQNFGKQVRLGRLDQLMLRPISISLQVLGSEFVLRRAGRIVQGLFILIAAINLTGMQWTIGKAIYLPLVSLGMICFFGGLFIIGATVTFWTYESIEVINIFTYGGTDMITYPMTIYPLWIQRFFTYILPAIFLNYYPALYFLDKPTPVSMPAYAPFLAPVAGLSVLIMAILFWMFGLRHYQSSGW